LVAELPTEPVNDGFDCFADIVSLSAGRDTSGRRLRVKLWLETHRVEKGLLRPTGWASRGSGEPLQRHVRTTRGLFTAVDRRVVRGPVGLDGGRELTSLGANGFEATVK
jgi:hypothetical protein